MRTNNATKLLRKIKKKMNKASNKNQNMFCLVKNLSRCKCQFLVFRLEEVSEVLEVSLVLEVF